MSTRRVFLKATGLSLMTYSLGGGPEFLCRAAMAAAGPRGAGAKRRTLVALFQRGAMDALMAVPPVDDDNLQKLRPRLAMQASRSASLVDLGNGFAFHPAFEPWLPLFRDKRLAVVHAVGSPHPTRSHFDAQDYMETGTPGRKGTPTGWLDRVVGELGHEGSPFRAVAMGPSLPRSLYGDAGAVAISRLEDFRVQLPGSLRLSQTAGRGFEALYEQTTQELLHKTAGETFEAVDLLSKIDLGASRGRSARYPRSLLGESLRQIATLIRADVGLEVAFAESGGWDTHVRQGTTSGPFAQSASDLAGAVAAFWEDIDGYHDQVMVMTMTEFGRTVRENGSGGTDHGHGSCLFLLGNDVRGGEVHGTLPKLDPDNLYEGRDLPVTTDFRSVFAGVARDHLGVDETDKLFPGWNGEPSSVLLGKHAQRQA